MTTLLLDLLSWACLLGGAFFIVVGALGLVRLPDVYSRMHGAGITDTLGAGLFLAGLMIQGGATLVSVKLFLIAVFIFFTSPTSTYAVANAAHGEGIGPTDGSSVGQICEAEEAEEESPS